MSKDDGVGESIRGKKIIWAGATGSCRKRGTGANQGVVASATTPKRKQETGPSRPPNEALSENQARKDEVTPQLCQNTRLRHPDYARSWNKADPQPPMKERWSLAILLLDWVPSDPRSHLCGKRSCCILSPCSVAVGWHVIPSVRKDRTGWSWSPSTAPMRYSCQDRTSHVLHSSICPYPLSPLVLPHSRYSGREKMLWSFPRKGAGSNW